MPTYDYECDACGHKFELFQQMSEDEKKKCPECKKNKLRRLFGTGAAIMFKGSGFYETDYRSDSYRKAAEKDSKAASESSTKSESKSASDSKSEKSPQAKSSGDSGSSGKSAKSDSGS